MIARLESRQKKYSGIIFLLAHCGIAMGGENGQKSRMPDDELDVFWNEIVMDFTAS